MAGAKRSGRRFPLRPALKVAGFTAVNALVAPSVLLALVIGWPEAAHQPWLLVLAALCGALLAAGLTLFGVLRLVAPLWRVEMAMRLYGRGGRILALPLDRGGLPGRLMRETHRLMTLSRQQIARSELSAETDPLTGLLNRRGFERRLARQNGGQGEEIPPLGAMIFFDLDYFKQVNDRYGHDAGDLVLQRVADLAAGLIRGRELLARFGGEEFVVWLPLAGAARAFGFAEALRTKIEQEAAEALAGMPPEAAFESPLRRLMVSEASIRVTASLGIALSTAEAPLATAEAIRRADAAAYRSKMEGRNRISPPQRRAA